MITKLLRNSLPLVIDIQLAKAVGLEEAIVIQQIHYWLIINQRNDRNLHAGYYWTYNSYTEWQKQFPFWSEHTVRRIFGDLEKKGYIISGNFNKLTIDRTKWYRLNYNKLEIPIPELEKPINENLLLPNDQNARPYGQNGQMDVAKLDRPLPEISDPEINNINKELKKKYGEFQNVLLTDHEHEKLQKKFGEETSVKIETLSRGIESKGYKYKSHYAAILNWDQREIRNNGGKYSGKTKQSDRSNPKQYTEPDEYFARNQSESNT